MARRREPITAVVDSIPQQACATVLTREGRAHSYRYSTGSIQVCIGRIEGGFEYRLEMNGKSSTIRAASIQELLKEFPEKWRNKIDEVFSAAEARRVVYEIGGLGADVRECDAILRGTSISRAIH